MKNANGCETSGRTIEVTSNVTTPPAPSTTGDEAYCINYQKDPIIANPAQEGTITWYSDPLLTDVISTGVLVNPAGITETTTYYVTKTDNNCESPSTKVTITIIDNEPVPVQQICLVTIDLTTGKNLIVWEKSPDPGIVQYNVYRESARIGEFNVIGTVAADNLSIFHDTTATPETKQDVYIITATDVCGNESVYGSFHKPMFLQYVGSTGGINLLWSDYEIEGDDIGFVTYEIYKGSTSTSLEKIDEVSARVDRYTDKDQDALTNRYFYRVAGLKADPCLPTGTLKGANADYSRAMSNLEDNEVVSVSDNIADKINIYPNPFNEKTTIKFNNPDAQPYTLCLTDLSGKVYRIEQNIITGKYILERSELQAGIYFVELRGPSIYRLKIIIE